MSICPDSWIKNMTNEYGMIEPFVEEQVRSMDGRPVITYGLSSFGYRFVLFYPEVANQRQCRDMKTVKN